MTEMMVERVARALQKNYPGREESSVPYTPLMMLLARVAVDAMREYLEELGDDGSK